MASRVKEDEKNERIIRNLLKLPDNRRCINCNSLGPQYVCTNFSTFICTNCSGIHREFTHRVKSVSMAKFSPQEVSALQGGGNASAREIYLKEWDAQRNSLPDGSNVERLRDFIKHVYVDRRFTGERNSEKPLRSKMGESDDFNGNRRTDSYQGSRSPPYEDRGERPGPGGRSPGYNQEMQRNIDNKRSPARPDVMNDWRREDRFGNGRKSEDRSSDGGSKPGGRSPDSQRSDMSSPPVVRPVRDILGDNVSPLRVIEPPKATVGKSIDPPPYTQRTVSSSSLASASSDGNPSEVKAEVSFIDFDSVPEPPVPPTSAPEKAATNASTMQLGASSGSDWANFDSAPQAKVNTPSSNSLEASLLDLSVPAPASGPSSSVGSSSFQSSELPFGVSAPSAHPPGGVPTASIGPEPHLTNATGNFVGRAPSGGQWPTMMPQPVPGFLGQQPQNPLVGPNTYGVSGVSVGQAPARPARDTSAGISADLPSNAKSGGRRELPADLFAMNYSYMPPVPGWHPGLPYGASVPMQYNMPMGVPNLQPIPNVQPGARSTNPFDLGNEASSDQASAFPSLGSLHGALPNAHIPSGLQPTPSLGTFSSHTSLMPGQSPSYASAIAPSPYLGQQVGGSIPPRPQAQSGFSLEENAFTSLYPSHQPGGLHTSHSAPSFASTGGNPFG